MKLTLRSLVLLIAPLFFGYSHVKGSMIEKNVTVTGKILNQDKFPDNYTIKIYETNLISLGTYHTAFINIDGSFTFEFEKSFSSDVYLMYGGSWIILFVGPGDSVYAEMDANEVLTSDFLLDRDIQSLKLSGNNEQINYEINEFFTHILSGDYKIGSINEKTLKPEEYLNYLKEVKVKRSHILDSLLKTKDYSDKFIKWSQLYIDYDFASKLFHYTWYYPLSNNTGISKVDVIDIPESFFKALKDIPISNEEAIMISTYSNFLEQYFHSNTYLFSTFSKKLRESQGKFAKSELFQEEFENYLKNIIKEYDGIASEIIISKQLFGLIETYKRMDVFEKLYPEYKNNIRESFCNILDKKYSEVNLAKKNPDKNKSFLKEENGIEVAANEILQKIIDRNKGKVIFLDFWATWCGPCLMEFEHSKKLTKTFEGKNVEFVYLCVKSEKEKWEEKLGEYNLSGSHYLLSDSEFDILSQKFQVVGIPHYVLIDKNGKTINNKAPRPSSGEQLTTLINKHIN